MPFNPVSTSAASFNPSNPTSGGNVAGDLYFGCNRTKDKERIRNYWSDLNKNYGLVIKYWRNGYKLTDGDSLYGEHPTSKFIGPRNVKVLLNIENQNTILSKFGIISEFDVQIYIPIDEFKRVWGAQIPNRGDLIQVSDEACDRPEQQEPKIFQITNKRDSVESVDFFGGHYVWFLEAQRFDYSWEENAPDEEGEPITDTDFVGIMEGGTQPKSPSKTYGPDADTMAKEDLDNTTNSAKYGNYL
jgi:hypothetical protein